jgi:hypothetical protein
MGYVGWRQVWEKIGVQRAAALCRGSGCPRKNFLFISRGRRLRVKVNEKGIIP